MSSHRKFFPREKYRKERQQVFEYLIEKPYSTIEEITRYMGYDKFFGGGIETFCILNQLNEWGLLKKHIIYIKNPVTLEKEVESKKIYTINDFLKLSSKKRIAAFKEIKTKGWQMMEMEDALHFSGLMTMSEAIEEEWKKHVKEIETHKIGVVYQVKSDRLSKLKFRLYNRLFNINWR